MQVLDQQENYLLVSDGARFTVVERRAGKLYGLGCRGRRGVPPDDMGLAELFRDGDAYSEPQARCLLHKVASDWRDLFELVR